MDRFPSAAADDPKYDRLLHLALDDYRNWAAEVPNRPVVDHQLTLTPGLSNQSVLVRSGTQRWVVRFSRTPTPLGTDFAREIEIHKLAANAGIAPAVVYANSEQLTLISEYVEDNGASLEIATLAELLRAIHQLPTVATTLHIPSRIIEYRDLLPREHPLAHLLEIARTQFSEACAVVQDESSGDRRLCHNDLLRANLRNGNRPMAIDWEYACTGDPWFDLAAASSELNDRDTLLLLTRYLEREPASAERLLLSAFSYLYQVLSALWTALYQAPAGYSFRQGGNEDTSGSEKICEETVQIITRGMLLP